MKNKKKKEIKMKKKNKREEGIESSHSTSILVWITIKIQMNYQHVVYSVPSDIHINTYCMNVITDISIIQSNYQLFLLFFILYLNIIHFTTPPTAPLSSFVSKYTFSYVQNTSLTTFALNFTLNHYVGRHDRQHQYPIRLLIIFSYFSFIILM